MALVFAAHEALPGRAGTIKSGRVSAVASKKGFRTMTRAIDLSTSTYSTGGWTLTPGLTGLAHVNDVTQLCGFTPFGAAVVPVGLQVALDYSTPASPKLKLYSAGAEHAAGAINGGVGVIWVTLYGRDV